MIPFRSLVLVFLVRSTMSDDIALQLPSNSRSSNPPLPTKLAKLEARMAGKSTSSLTVQTARPPAPPPPTRFPEQEKLLDSSSDDDVSLTRLIILTVLLLGSICDFLLPFSC